MLARALSVLLLTFAFVQPAAAQKAPAIGEVAWAQLPQEARETLALIHKGGPYPYA